jgi:hypothetical protein
MLMKWKHHNLKSAARLAGAVAAAIGLALATPVLAPAPTLAAGFTPVPPAGWHVSRVTEPAWAQRFLFNRGVLVASTDLFDSAGLQSHYDAYRLQSGAEANPVATVLRGAVSGVVWDLDRGLLLYSRIRPGTNPGDQVYDLYVRDLGSGAITEIPIPTGLSLYPGTPPQVDAGHVVWSQSGFQHEAEVMLYDVASKKLTSLTPNPTVSNENPSIAGDDIVWQSWDGQTHSILHHSLKTGTTEVLASGLPWTAMLSPQVDRGRVVWVTHDWVTPVVSRSILYLRDLSAAGNSIVAQMTGPGTDIEAQLSGDLLVACSAPDAENYELAVQNLSTGAAKSLATFRAQPLAFSVSDGVVVWQDSQSSASDQGYSGKVFAYDTASGTTTKLAEGLGIGRPLTDHGRVVFMQTVDSVTSALWLAEPDDVLPYDYFLDVNADEPHGPAILDFVGKGYVEGYATGAFRTFDQGNPLLRAQLAKILVNALGLSADEALSTTFTDLGPDDPGNLFPHEYVAAAVEAGLLKGYSSTEFGPWDKLTRAQMVTVLVRAVRELSPTTLLTPPADFVGSVTGGPLVHAESLRVAEYNGLLDDLTGFGPYWDPNSFARRGEVIQLLYGLHLKKG